MPTLRAFECLIAVVEAGSITDAARRLHLSQPAVSSQIAQLEREAGTSLLHRRARGVCATSAGSAMLAEARRSIDTAARAMVVARATAQGKGGRLRVGVVESLTVPVLAPVLRAWHRRSPDVGVDVLEFSSGERLPEALETAEIDLAVGPAEANVAHSTTIGIEQGVVVFAADHPFAGLRAIPWLQLADAPIVHFQGDNGLAAWIDGAAAAHGVALRAVHRTRSAPTASALAAAGLAPAIVPASAVVRGQTARPLHPPLERRIAVSAASEADALAERFRRDLVRRGLPALARSS